MANALGFFLYSRLFETKAGRLTAIFLGFLFGLVFIIRPLAAIFLLGMAFFLPRIELIQRFAIGATISLWLGIRTNIALYGTWRGPTGYAEVIGETATFHTDAAQAFFSLLFSPNRGALVFFPLLFFLLPLLLRHQRFGLGWAKLLERIRRLDWTVDRKDRDQAVFQIAILGTALYLIALSFVNYWHGSWGYGPRYLHDIQIAVWFPLSLFFYRTWKSTTNQRGMKAAMGIAAVWSIFLHGLGHRNFTLYVWNQEVRPHGFQSAWNTQNLQIVRTWNAGPSAKRVMSSKDRLERLGY
jgi:hypothetical protein